MALTIEWEGTDSAYDEFNPVAAFRGDVGCYISTNLVVFKDAKLHGQSDNYHAILMNDKL